MALVLVFHDLPIAEAIRERRPDLEVVSLGNHAAVRERLHQADVLLTNPPGWDDAYLDALSPGDWVQTTSAGYGAFPVETLAERGVLFTTAAGLNASTVAEHVFALALAFTRRIPVYSERQRDHAYDRSDTTRLSDCSGDALTVVGLGHVGEAVARRGLAFEMTVRGVKRNPEAYDGVLQPNHVLGPAGLHSVLPETDLLVLAVPLTDETRGLVDAAVFDALPDSAHLINVARGAIVDQSALLSALETGRLAGAGLDVFDPEPLPPDSPLWDRDDVLVTPHVAGRSDAFVPRFVDSFLENLDRLAAGEPLENRPVGG